MEPKPKFKVGDMVSVGRKGNGELNYGIIEQIDITHFKPPKYNEEAIYIYYAVRFNDTHLLGGYTGHDFELISYDISLALETGAMDDSLKKPLFWKVSSEKTWESGLAVFLNRLSSLGDTYKLRFSLGDHIFAEA